MGRHDERPWAAPAGAPAVTVDVLAVGAHPDDVELGCGGTVAKLVRLGRRVGILHIGMVLVDGEIGRRGFRQRHVAPEICR